MSWIDKNLFEEIFILINSKINDIEFIIFLILSIFSLVIKKHITDSIAQSEKIFLNTQKEKLNKLNKIYFSLVQLVLKPNSKSKTKKLYKLLLKNPYTIDSKKDNYLLENFYENYTKNKDLNEKLIVDYLGEVQTKIKEINNTISKNSSKYLEYQSNSIIFYLKKGLSALVIIIFIIVILYVLRFLFIKYLLN